MQIHSMPETNHHASVPWLTNTAFAKYRSNNKKIKVFHARFNKGALNGGNGWMGAGGVSEKKFHIAVSKCLSGHLLKDDKSLIKAKNEWMIIVQVDITQEFIEIFSVESTGRINMEMTLDFSHWRSLPLIGHWRVRVVNEQILVQDRTGKGILMELNSTGDGGGANF